MTDLPPGVWEDDEYIYVPEELFQHFPQPYREAIEAQRQQGSDALRIADQDIQSLVRLAHDIPAASSLSYIYHRLRTATFEPTTEVLMEQEMMTTAFVVTYARLFNSRRNGSGIARSKIPAHLRQVHDDIIDIRHKRYAHTDEHRSVGSGVEIKFSGSEFNVELKLQLGLYIGGRNEWAELVSFIDEYIYDRLQKILKRLEDKTGYKWSFPGGPAPSWVGNYG